MVDTKHAYLSHWHKEDLETKRNEDNLRDLYCDDGVCKGGNDILVDISDEPLKLIESPYQQSFIPSHSKYVVGDVVTRTCADIGDTFREYFGCDVLDGFDNIVIAGGFVVSSLDASTGNSVASTGIDVDCFVHGLNPDGTLSDKEIRAKFDSIVSAFLLRIYQARMAKTGGILFLDHLDVVFLRTEDSITFMAPAISDVVAPLKIQIIQRDYVDKFHILSGFDISVCCVLYDGKKVLALPRAVRDLARQEMLVDVDRQSSSFEYRLLKYSKFKGFLITVPGLDMSRMSVSSMLDAVNLNVTLPNSVSRGGESGGLMRIIVCKLQKFNVHMNTPTYGVDLKLDMKSKECFGPRAKAAARQLSIKQDKTIVMSSMYDAAGYSDRDKGFKHMYNTVVNRQVGVLVDFYEAPHLAKDNSSSEVPVPKWVTDTSLKKGDCHSFRPVNACWFAGLECMIVHV